METPLLLSDDPRALDALGDVEVLYTDLDGTLLAKGGCVLADAEGAPSGKVAETIVALNRSGLTVVPVSGRGRIQLTEVVRLLGWRDFIAEAGAVIVHGVGPGAEVLYNNAEWPESLLMHSKTPYELIDESGAYEALLAAFPGRVEYHEPWHLDREATHLLRGCFDADEAQAVLDALHPPIGLLDNGLVRTVGDLDCDASHLPHAYHLVPKGVSKAQAIALDLQTRGLRPEQAAAIGDSATDIEMADAVAVMALVDNAFESAGVTSTLAKRSRDNVWRTCCRRGEGWAEFVRAWLDARGVAQPA
jgi:hydroxymethylpyrimidine pyrophosphatase-like HAD family hydrolase